MQQIPSKGGITDRKKSDAKMTNIHQYLKQIHEILNKIYIQKVSKLELIKERKLNLNWQQK